MLKIERRLTRVFWTAQRSNGIGWAKRVVRQGDAMGRCGALKRRATTGRQQASGFQAGQGTRVLGGGRRSTGRGVRSSPARASQVAQRL